MNLFSRFFLGYLFLILLAVGFFYKSIMDELRPATRQAMEEAMVDTANLLAEILAPAFLQDTPDLSAFSSQIDSFLARNVNAHIWGYTKRTPSYRIYITDAQGIVVYDSDKQDVGKDYSKWNDVYLTLQGKYGARSTRISADDATSSILYVAAPIRHKNIIVGVVTVAKPALSIQPFVELSRHNIVRAVLLLGLAALIIGGILSYWLTKSIRRLVQYADEVRAGKKPSLPYLQEPELAQLAHSMESMRLELEGKAYVERYLHTLTHEIKSPLSGIRGAAELLQEEMSGEDRHKFLKNINRDTIRMQYIIDRLLSLAAVESKSHLDETTPVSIKECVFAVLEQKAHLLQQKAIDVTVDVSDSDRLSGDSFLIEQAISNLLDNALDFTPDRGHVTFKGTNDERDYSLTISDSGTGIPVYAHDKVFERFYSLPRPDTGRRSSGIGLNFVREVMNLHHGNITIQPTEQGTEIKLVFPKS